MASCPAENAASACSAGSFYSGGQPAILNEVRTFGVGARELSKKDSPFAKVDIQCLLQNNPVVEFLQRLGSTPRGRRRGRDVVVFLPALLRAVLSLSPAFCFLINPFLSLKCNSLKWVKWLCTGYLSARK